MDKTVKIFISYHKNSTLLKNEVLEPIEVGADLKNQHEKMLQDNSNDNISKKNENFCELTAQYWAWKNCDFDYIGFMHYRRHLNFSDKIYDENVWGLIEDEVLNKNYIKKYSLEAQNIKNLVEKYDIVTVKPWNVQNAGSKNNYDHYKNSDKKLKIKDYDKALEILSNKYPDFVQDIKSYNESELGYYTNIFIMKKEHFNSYCTWLFDILFELEKQIDTTKYNKEEKRVFGYISEWLFGIYITHIKRTTDLKIKELQRTLVKNCDFIQNNDAINICFATDNNYIQHLGAAIASILKNTKTKKQIDFYVLNDGSLKNKNKKKLKNLEKLKNEVSINFLNIDGKIFKNFYLMEKSHFTYATYYRYLIPDILDEISKVIYLDCDIVVVDDIEKLHSIFLEDDYIAATSDILSIENKLRLNLQNYYNAGVLLMNLEKMRKNNISKKLIKATKKYENIIKWQDQDIINLVFQNKIKNLDLAWNFQYFYDDSEVDFERKEFEAAKKNPKIIHFVGHIKPWDTYSMRPYEKEYFKYLKLTPWKNFCYKHAFKSFLKSMLNKKNTNRYVIVSFLGFKFKKIRKFQLLRNDIKKLQKEIWKLHKENQKLLQSNKDIKQTVFDIYLDNLILKREFEPYNIKKYLTIHRQLS